MSSGILEEFSDAVEAIAPYLGSEEEARQLLQQMLVDSGFDRLLFEAAVDEYLEELDATN